MVEGKNIKALLFDLGGVVIDINFDLAFQAWAKKSLLTYEEIRENFSMDSRYEQHERGEISTSEYFNHLRKILKLESSNEDIALGWNAIFVGEINETLSTILKRKRDIPCFAFTNSNPMHQAFWMAAYPRVISAFDHIFVSSSLGLRKPERAAFSAISQATGVDLANILFFDDTPENVEGAREAGLQVVYAKTPSDVKEALSDIVND